MRGHQDFSSPNYLLQQPRKDQSRSALLGAGVGIALKPALSPFLWEREHTDPRVKELTIKVSFFSAFWFVSKKYTCLIKLNRGQGVGARRWPETLHLLSR